MKMTTVTTAAGSLALTLFLCGPILAAGANQAGATRDTFTGTAETFAKLDIDANGVLSEAEAAGAKGLLDYWYQVDRNGDGVIGRTEFAAFEARGPMPPNVAPPALPDSGGDNPTY